MIKDIFQRSKTYQNLTPGERAFLQVLGSLLTNGLTTGLLAAGGYLMAPGMIDPQNLVYIAIMAVVFSVAHGVAKYVSAQGDPALGAAIEMVTSAEQQRVPMPMTSAPPPNRPTTMQLQPPSQRFTSMTTLPDLPAIPLQPPQQQPPSQRL
jgi:hypothetical protein